MCKRLGRHTVKLEKPVYITAAASTAGKKEGEGPLRECLILFSTMISGENNLGKG